MTSPTLTDLLATWRTEVEECCSLHPADSDHLCASCKETNRCIAQLLAWEKRARELVENWGAWAYPKDGIVRGTPTARFAVKQCHDQLLALIGPAAGERP